MQAGDGVMLFHGGAAGQLRQDQFADLVGGKEDGGGRSSGSGTTSTTMSGSMLGSADTTGNDTENGTRSSSGSAGVAGGMSGSGRGGGVLMSGRTFTGMSSGMGPRAAEDAEREAQRCRVTVSVGPTRLLLVLPGGATLAEAQSELLRQYASVFPDEPVLRLQHFIDDGGVVLPANLRLCDLPAFPTVQLVAALPNDARAAPQTLFQRMPIEELLETQNMWQRYAVKRVCAQIEAIQAPPLAAVLEREPTLLMLLEEVSAVNILRMERVATAARRSADTRDARKGTASAPAMQGSAPSDIEADREELARVWEHIASNSPLHAMLAFDQVFAFAKDARSTTQVIAAIERMATVWPHVSKMDEDGKVLAAVAEFVTQDVLSQYATTRQDVRSACEMLWQQLYPTHDARVPVSPAPPPAHHRHQEMGADIAPFLRGGLRRPASRVREPTPGPQQTLPSSSSSSTSSTSSPVSSSSPYGMDGHGQQQQQQQRRQQQRQQQSPHESEEQLLMRLASTPPPPKIKALAAQLPPKLLFAASHSIQAGLRQSAADSLNELSRLRARLETLAAAPIEDQSAWLLSSHQFNYQEPRIRSLTTTAALEDLAQALLMVCQVVARRLPAMLEQAASATSAGTEERSLEDEMREARCHGEWEACALSLENLHLVVDIVHRVVVSAERREHDAASHNINDASNSNSCINKNSDAHYEQQGGSARNDIHAQVARAYELARGILHQYRLMALLLVETAGLPRVQDQATDLFIAAVREFGTGSAALPMTASDCAALLARSTNSSVRLFCLGWLKRCWEQHEALSPAAQPEHSDQTLPSQTLLPQDKATQLAGIGTVAPGPTAKTATLLDAATQRILAILTDVLATGTEPVQIECLALLADVCNQHEYRHHLLLKTRALSVATEIAARREPVHTDLLRTTAKLFANVASENAQIYEQVLRAVEQSTVLQRSRDEIVAFYTSMIQSTHPPAGHA